MSTISSLFIRRILNSDKIIGKCMSTKQNNGSFDYKINDAIMDTIITQTDDIKHMKLELIGLNFKLKQIIDKLDLNGNEIATIKSQVQCAKKDFTYKKNCGI